MYSRNCGYVSCDVADAFFTLSAWMTGQRNFVVGPLTYGRLYLGFLVPLWNTGRESVQRSSKQTTKRNPHNKIEACIGAEDRASTGMDPCSPDWAQSNYDHRVRPFLAETRNALVWGRRNPPQQHSEV